MVKYQSRLELIKPITQPMADLLSDFYLEDQWPEVVIPVPLHEKRLRKRGYDQALLVAKALKKQLPDVITLENQLIKRVKHSSPQQNLDAKDRQKNIKQAFALQKNLQYRHIALVDDVVTTGATVSEITKLLKKAGAERVDIWSIARTPENQ